MLKKTLLSAAVLWTVVVLVLCLIRLDSAPKVSVANFDKFVHALFHFVFTTLWYLYFILEFKKAKKYKPFLAAFLFSVFLGIAIELAQKYCTVNRSGDVLDVLANTFGATIAIGFILLLDRYNCLKKIS